MSVPLSVCVCVLLCCANNCSGTGDTVFIELVVHILAELEEHGRLGVGDELAFVAREVGIDNLRLGLPASPICELVCLKQYTNIVNTL